MATSDRPTLALAHTWRAFLAFRPAFALAAAGLPSAGHTASFREMEAARGWVAAEGYSFHSLFLLSIALTLVVAPRPTGGFRGYWLVVAGLSMLAVGSVVNAAFLQAPLGFLEAGRVLAGI